MPLDRPVPPAGEEIHIPGGSVQPLLLAIGITMALLGITISIMLVIVGLVLMAAVLVVWIRDAVDEYRHLPLDHAPVVADTVPDPGNRPDGTASSP